MVLPKPAMYTGGNKPKLRAVMLQNVAGLHYICITAQKPPANIDSLSVPALTGKYDFYFTVGFPVIDTLQVSHEFSSGHNFIQYMLLTNSILKKQN